MTTRRRNSRRAPHGAPFAFWRLAGALLAALAALTQPAAAALCPAGTVDRKVSVRYVIDGDTVILGDGRHVRLIGLNAPEIAHGDQPGEPLGDAARTALVRLLADARGPIGLRYGRERRDRHGRTLASLYLPDGTNVTAALLRGGWGAAIAIPPNLRQQACLRTAEREARVAARGIWRQARYQGRELADPDAAEQGFRILRGRVTGLGHSRYALWLRLADGVSLRIDREDLPYFDSEPPQGLVGRTVSARGWLVRRGGRWHMSIHHPLDLEVAPSR